MLGTNYIQILKENEKPASVGRAPSQSAFKMENCPNCDRKGKVACNYCMEQFYNHMHDPDTGRPLEVIGGVRNMVTSSRKHSDIAESKVQYSEKHCFQHYNRFIRFAEDGSEIRKMVKDKCQWSNGSGCVLTAQGKTLHCQRSK